MGWKEERRDQYRKKLLDARWQEKRLRIFERDGFSCRLCHSGKDDGVTLNVHHVIYEPGEPWDTADTFLISLCSDCHTDESETLKSERELLIRALCSFGLWSSADIHELACAFGLGEAKHLPEVVASALSWAIRDEDEQRRLVDRYLESLSRRKAKGEG